MFRPHRNHAAPNTTGALPCRISPGSSLAPLPATGLRSRGYALGRGYNVVATARSIAKLTALTTIAPDRVLTQKLEVTVPADAENAVKAAVARFGRIDVLINNAGYGIVGAVEETPQAEYRAQ